MQSYNWQYASLVESILTLGEKRTDRTGTGTLSLFAPTSLRFDLENSFPLIGLKETKWRIAFAEMLWFISGSTNTQPLNDQGIKLWNPWADAKGDLGPIYGSQWRNFNDDGIDQLAELIKGLRENPTSRRHIVTAWNPSRLHQMALPPCHYLFQCYVSNDEKLTLMLNQRSWDVMLGAPFNIAQYALLTHLIARAAGLTASKLIINPGDAHIYLNHVEAARMMLKRMDDPHSLELHKPAKLGILTSNTDIDGYLLSDFAIGDYHFFPHIKLPVAV